MSTNKDLQGRGNPKRKPSEEQLSQKSRKDEDWDAKDVENAQKMTVDELRKRLKELQY